MRKHRNSQAKVSFQVSEYPVPANVDGIIFSELSPHTATLLATLFPKYLDQSSFRVVNGDKDAVQRLLQEPYGHILYTGGATVGKIVMKAAAEHLTPVTLELGGRNAAVVTEHANVELAATRIAWAKFAIAGQTCFAPNHAIVHASVYDAFVEALKKVGEVSSV